MVSPEGEAVPETVGERIRVALHGAGLTQLSAAPLLGVTRHAVGGWISGKIKIPEKRLKQVAELTGKSVAWLRYGMTDAAQVSVERYVTGFEDAKAIIAERFARVIAEVEPPLDAALAEPEGRPGVRDAKPPQIRGGYEESEPLQPAPSKRKRDRRA